MPTATVSFERKGVFHSELVPATDPHGIEVVFKHTPRDSKYPNKPPYIRFDHNGSEYTYTIENDEIKEYLNEVPLDTPVVFAGFGSRDGATVTVESLDGTSRVGGKGGVSEQSQPAPTTNPPERTGIEDEYFRCLIAARGAVERFKGVVGDPPTDDHIRIASTLFIQAQEGR